MPTFSIISCLLCNYSHKTFKQRLRTNSLWWWQRDRQYFDSRCCLTCPGSLLQVPSFARWCHLSSPPLSWQKPSRWPALLWRDTRGSCILLKWSGSTPTAGPSQCWVRTCPWQYQSCASFQNTENLCNMSHVYELEQESPVWLVGIDVSFQGFSHLRTYCSLPSPLSLRPSLALKISPLWFPWVAVLNFLSWRWW